jgi:hypothetical protein
MPVEISQRNGFVENGLANQRAQGSANHHLDASPQELFEVSNHAARKPGRGLASDVDKKVDIAFRGIFTPCHGSEKTDIASAVPGSDLQDVVAAVSYVRGDAHRLYCNFRPAETEN